ncbi:MAG: DUF4176 domain-containing protein [Streptococcaceae bacterium]|jgi:hypothetical protein|nr:DUF4176 domain-containing protein [Streptococcaceae bacterium]
MKLPKIMTASFEESLILQDDRFVQYMIKDVEKLGVKEKPVLLKVLALLFISLLYGFSMLIKYFIDHSDPDSSVPEPQINFFPAKLFWLMLTIFILIWIITLIRRTKGTKFFFAYLNTTNYLRWLIIVVNLFFVTFMFIPLTVLGVLIFFGAIGIIGYIIGRSKIKSLNEQLFNIKESNDRIDNFIQKIFKAMMKYGWLLLVGIALWKFIFPGTTGVRTDIVGFIGIVAMWFVMDIAIIVAEIYLFTLWLLQK